jgi:MinD-like ATPase involved in chromosome partitioning or flagellar assembly
MKVAIFNFSGNVGKTTLAANMFSPRMNDAHVFSLESTNSDAARNGIEVVRLRGEEWGEVQEALMDLDDAIIDVGSSNAEHFMLLMQQFVGSHNEIDYFVVPTKPSEKEIGDTLKSIRSLAALGVPRAKIRLLMNMVGLHHRIEGVFSPLIQEAETARNFTFNPAAVVHTNEAFDRLQQENRSVGAVAADTTDYRAQLRDTQDQEQKAQLRRLVSLQRCCVSAQENLDGAFKALFSKR